MIRNWDDSILAAFRHPPTYLPPYRKPSHYRGSELETSERTSLIRIHLDIVRRFQYPTAHETPVSRNAMEVSRNNLRSLHLEDFVQGYEQFIQNLIDQSPTRNVLDTTLTSNAPVSLPIPPSIQSPIVSAQLHAALHDVIVVKGQEYGIRFQVRIKSKHG